MFVEITSIGTSFLALIGLGMVGCCCPDQQQQQQQSVQVVGEDNEEPKRICPECGLENPREAGHCGDCGFKFRSSSNSNGSDSDE